MTISIDTDFEAGAVEVLALEGAKARLALPADAPGPWRQWFYFRVRGAKGVPLELAFVNCAASAYPEGWPGYRACYSEDLRDWRRVDTTYADGVLTIRAIPAADEAFFAYFAPYPLARSHALLERTAAATGGTLLGLGRSVEGRPIEGIRLGSGPAPVWILGRQHCGETMASWWMEGALERLADPADAAAADILKRATLSVVPIVNVDGAARGYQRGNAAGIDLNRQWGGPDPVKAPEIAALLAAMDATGCAVILDIHGDESLPHVFIDGCDVDPEATPAQIAGVEAFRQALLAADDAFQTKVGYPVTYAGGEAPGMCTRAVPRRYGAVGVTLEMPFKDSLDRPDPVRGWSPAASMAMGRNTLVALQAVLARQ
ncbi:MAG TPA: M14-type cytosolic carboxypeptidase [Caulobacteraceae bacterium]|nr:M14-type cytosolic carboxypeptidase [Caulobacteraceae bacterium]